MWLDDAPGPIGYRLVLGVHTTGVGHRVREEFTGSLARESVLGALLELGDL